MKQGSVRVKVGDSVTRGQVLGQVGQTSVEGLDLVGRPLQTGWIVTTRH